MRLPADPPPLADLIHSQDPKSLLDLTMSGLGNLPENKYLHWSTLRYRTPPEGLTAEQWWLATKMKRIAARHVLPLLDEHGRPFTFADSGYLHRMLHEVDRHAGAVALPQDVANPDARDLYLKNSLMEEAITSSQLEGASTTRVVAKAMLRSGREARDLGERMIRNNYRAMEFVREAVDAHLSVDMLLELHAVLTEDTLDASSVGRLRRADEDVAVVDQRDGEMIHRPPHAAQLTERLGAVFAFANDANDAQFLHPVVRAIVLHFMIGYEHPFVDGNGRAARALFYWAMARAGYWLAEFLSISTVIRKAPVQYMRAYVYSERDDNDVTYFLDYNLRVMLRALDELRRYLSRKAAETLDAQRLLDASPHGGRLNHRQIEAIRSLRKRPRQPYTIAEHQRATRVTYQTARTDLLELAELGVLAMVRTRKQGRAFHFTLAAELRQGN